MIEYLVDEENDGVRVDRLAEALGLGNRSQLKKLIDAKLVSINGETAKSATLVRSGDKVTLANDNSAPELNFDLKTVYEDDDVIVFDKPAGMLTHKRNMLDKEMSVESAVASLTTDEGLRAGIVHRLDRDTSGLIIAAKSKAAKEFLQKQFADRTVTKKYLAIVEGQPRDEAAVLDWPIERNPNKPFMFRVGANGKSAQTQFKLIEAGAKYSLVELTPRTGRTHQLRVHLMHYGNPILGDRIYGGHKAERLYLHACYLSLTLPNGKKQTFKSKIDWQSNNVH